jgi:phage shock protein A
MGILERVNRIVRTNVNQLLERAEDPQRSLQQHVEEMRQSAQQARRALVDLEQSSQQARARQEECLQESRRWEERAMMALRSGDEELARQALVYKHKVDQRAEQLDREARISSEYVDQLRAQVDLLESKAALAQQRAVEIANRRVQLQAEEERLQAPAAPGSGIPPMADPSLRSPPAFEEFARLDDRLTQLDAEMTALDELNAGLFAPAQTELDQRFKDLEKDQRERDLSGTLTDLRRRIDRDR